MRTRKAVFIAAVAAGLAFIGWATHYNSFESRLQRDLLAAYERALGPRDGNLRAIASGKLQDDINQVVQRAGTNGIPVLLEWIAEDAKPLSKFKQEAQQLAKRLNIQSPMFWNWSCDSDLHERAYLASRSLPAFGSAAKIAVPRLNEMAQAKPTGNILAQQTLRALGENP